MLKKALVFAAGFAFCYRLYFALVFSYGLYNHAFNHQPGKCHVVKGFDEGSEDMVQLSDGTVITSHGLGYLGTGRPEDYASAKGELSVFDLNKPELGAQRLKIVKTDGLKLDVDRMQTHGLGHFNDGKDDYVFMVNHGPGGDSVEKFRYAASSRSLFHVKSYRHPLFDGLNDVAPFGPDSFYTTNLIHFHDSFLKYAEIFLLLPVANTVLFENGQARKVAYATMMNGVSMSPDRKFVYIAQTSPAAGFGIYERQQDNSLQFVRHFPTVTLVDNIAVLANGDLVLGTQVSGLKSIMKIMDRFGVLSPSEVLYVRMKNASLVESVSSLLADDGALVNGASIATVKGKHLLIGTFHEKMVYCDVNIPY